MSNKKECIETLKQQLAALEAEDKKERLDKREQYEKKRDKIAFNLCVRAAQIMNDLEELKAIAFASMDEFREEMLEYGDIKFGVNNKGTFEIKTDKYRVSVNSQIIKGFDERAELGAAKLKEFLNNFVKKRDKHVFAIVNALLERKEESGDFDISMINRLYKMEDKFNDPNWKDGIRIFKESYNPTKTARYIRFAIMDDNGTWNPIVLDFAKTKIQKEVTNDPY